MKKLILAFSIICVASSLSARAGGAGGIHSSSHTSKSIYTPAKTSGSSKSYTPRVSRYSGIRTSLTYNKNNITNYNVTTISHYTGYQSNHPFNNPLVWMMLMSNHNNSRMTDDQFEAHAHILLLTQVCSDFYYAYGSTAERTHVIDNGVQVISRNKEYLAMYDNTKNKTKFLLTCSNITEREAKRINNKQESEHIDNIILSILLGALFLGVVWLGWRAR